MGVHQLFFNPFRDCVPFNTESALQTAQARAFLAGVDDDFFLFWAVGVATRVFAVLFLAGFATVALSAVWCANARQVLDYEQEAKPNLMRSSLWQ